MMGFKSLKITLAPGRGPRVKGTFGRTGAWRWGLSQLCLRGNPGVFTCSPAELSLGLLEGHEAEADELMPQ